MNGVMTVNEEFVLSLTFQGGERDALLHVGGTIGESHDVLHLGPPTRRRDWPRRHD